jgi:hypothetical protein
MISIEGEPWAGDGCCRRLFMVSHTKCPVGLPAHTSHFSQTKLPCTNIHIFQPHSRLYKAHGQLPLILIPPASGKQLRTIRASSCTTAPGVSRPQDASSHFNYMIRSVTNNAAQLAQIKPPPKAHTPTGTYS